LLLRANQPVFVTINVRDFWRRVQSHPDYCIVLVDLAQDEALELLSVWIRRLFAHPDFATMASRLGKVVLLREGGCDYYERSRQIHNMAS